MAHEELGEAEIDSSLVHTTGVAETDDTNAAG